MPANDPSAPPFPLPPPSPSFPPAAAIYSAADPSRTVYGPAVVGTMRVEDPAALAALASLRAPEVPRPAPVPVEPWPAQPWPTPPAKVPPLVVAGAALAVPLAPLGLLLSTIGLWRLLRTVPRPPGELVAVLSIATSALVLLALVVAAAQ